MILRSKPAPRRSRAGLTLFEALLSLALLSLITAVAIAGLRGPSPSVRLHRAAAELKTQVSEARLRAIDQNILQVLTLSEAACGSVAPSVTLYPDGTAQGGPFCLFEQEQSLILHLDPVTGKLIRDEDHP